MLTGASSGIGIETARALAWAGADLVLGVRDLGRGEAALAGIKARLLRLDLGDLRSVIDFAARISGPVDVLICNAGISKSQDSHLPNGLEVRFATNHLGHFLLAHQLKRQMAHGEAGRGARIVVVSSAAHKGLPVRLDDLQWTKRPHMDGAAYAESKSANILFAQEATRRWSGDGIFANALLPGSALTGLQRYHGEALKRKIGFIDAEGNVDPMVKTVEQAAATSVWAATAPELEGRGGLVLEDCGEALPVGPETHAWAGFDPAIADPETARRLWDHSLDLVTELVG
ncbi:SDR family NAD(P)-dependent oxidoreductase [Novosphingobium sp. RD2P27]|uniref:SDR family NAD(P)-dependent oxidoreductase n=1 Tax=Novosphingobium kalidii TaxID=3230299 RepID=A0ABV2D2P6_9SPHN